MIGFFIKKAFFDGWDNLIGMVVLNLGFLLILLAGIGSLTLLSEIAILPVVLLVLTAGLFAFFTAGSAHLTWAWARYERPGWDGFVRGIRISWRHALLYWLLFVLDFALILFVIPFYLAYGTIVGTVLSVLLFWLFIALSLALLYYWPLFYAMQGDRPTKTLRKSFVIVADNLFFPSSSPSSDHHLRHQPGVGRSRSRSRWPAPRPERRPQAAHVQVRLARGEPRGRPKARPLG